VRVSDLKRMSSVRRKVSIIRNSNPSQDIAELQPASKGSQLLGMKVT
jgi:(E)-4-hydroxy-3-methylbut-2-enyl-diphosphate synthase